MLSLREARERISAAVIPVDRETTHLECALGRILRETVRSQTDAPAFDRSAMDGYAISREGDMTGQTFELAGSIEPGAPVPTLPIGAGSCLRILTGAGVPPGARVVIQENVALDGNLVRVVRDDGRTHVRRRGEDVAAGDPLVQAGAQLGPAELSILAGAGAMHLCLSRLVRVAHLVTGDELIDPAVEPTDSQIRDTNSILIRQLVEQSRVASVVRHQRLGDNFQRLRTAFATAPADEVDVILVSGGASVGDRDFAWPALEAEGFQMCFRQISVRPGKPLTFATRGHQLAFAIPGNPVSHFCLFHLLIKPTLMGLAGSRHAEPTWMAGIMGTGLAEKPNARETWWPSRWECSDGDEARLNIHPLRWASSGHLSALAEANALLHLPPHLPPPSAGQPARWIAV
jgi:molybdopterin molybdotransferase